MANALYLGLPTACWLSTLGGFSALLTARMVERRYAINGVSVAILVASCGTLGFIFAIHVTGNDAARQESCGPLAVALVALFASLWHATTRKRLR